MTAKDKSALMAAMRERRNKAGMVQVLVWVPRAAVERLRAYAKKLAKESKQ